jgi:NAD-dependent deacetylase
MDHKTREAASVLSRCRQLVVFTGAGMSKESGIATFREAQQGLWEQYDPHELATIEGFMSNPELVWTWYQDRFGRISDVEPNAGHQAIAELEQHVPRVVVITQNIDNLHREAGSSEVVELHGNWQLYKCLNGHTGFTMDDFCDQAEIPPRCPECSAMLRPDVVWFGEMLPQDAWERAFDECQWASVMLVVGTSGLVQPAASLPYQAKLSGAMIIEVNPERSAITPLAEIYLRGTAAGVLPTLLELMTSPDEDTQ